MTDTFMEWGDFNIQVGSRISFAVGDRVYTDVVTALDEDKETGVITLVLGEKHR